ncbi:UDP-N-acetylglucosamine 1-carboxyvinyltransferase [Tumebacillus sp. ITR2]|uniref:UDP-N-acetylglucosamine 1-carboxyvinyltransferase n=1 Tax=Tumebacillus amylolyticus TaxID=2801339 RepID=A0ABS1J651_9BACL|nr:UDP-N-acetylglucosamine 1-carboxyvinyltransferase [Tumebacillus amylolyticus]MBL0385749.1 UDP-N-acetylglucosamine 1-carboxyvinyltransferase [Tumebacillus amylolyticus]
MELLRVKGGQPLHGEIQASGSKNSVLAIMCAVLLCDGETILENVPELSDVNTLMQILEETGLKCEWIAANTVRIQNDGITNSEVSEDLVRKMRASFSVLGPLLAKSGKAMIPLPGGCVIGARPVDQHLKAMRSLGATVTMTEGAVTAESTGRLKGSAMFLGTRYGATVGGTNAAISAGALAEGTTMIYNAAREPEIVDLVMFLNKAGARIRGVGTDIITIEGVESLKGVRYSVMGDRIESGTYLCAGAITRGRVTVSNIAPQTLAGLPSLLFDMGCDITMEGDSITVDATNRELRATNVITFAYPGFATDLQPAMLTLLTTAKGISYVKETVFDARFGFTQELTRMGADIKISGDTAIVNGVETLNGARVLASDLRAAGALIVAGLASQGSTTIEGLQYLDRGYESPVEKFKSLGAQIDRVQS